MNGFMTLEHSMAVRARHARRQGLAEGEAIGIEKGEAVGAERAEQRRSALIDRLLDDKRFDDLKQSTTDPQLLEALYAEYGL